jgi:hypothetical protein
MSNDKSKIIGIIAGLVAMAGIGALAFYLLSRNVSGGGGYNPSNTGSLKLTVAEANTNKPIQGAVVTISNSKLLNARDVISYNTALNTQSVNTDSNGIAVINNIPEGRYLLTVKCGGYNDYSTTIQITANYVTTLNVSLTINQNNPPDFVNTITIITRWVGNSYPNIPSNAGLSYMHVIAKRPDGTVLAEGLTDTEGKFTFKYAFKTSDQQERIDIYTLESVFEPYLPFLLSPSSNALYLKYNYSGSQPPIVINFSENNVLYLDVTPKVSIGSEAIVTPATTVINNIPLMSRNGNLPLLLTANGYPLTAFTYLFATLYMFGDNSNSRYLSCFKRGDLVYPDYKTNPTPYDYTKYPFKSQIDPYKTTYWATRNYPAILPKIIVNNTDVVALFETAPIRVGYKDTTHDTFSTVFLSCAWNSNLSRNIIKFIPVRTIGQSPTTAYEIYKEGTDLTAGIGIGVWCYHNNPENQERYVDQFLNPQSRGWQVITDSGVIK